MKQIPEFLQNLYYDTQRETRPFSKIFAFINLSEAVIKFYTVVTVQNFLETEEGNPSLEEGKAVLGKGLARPSLGLWAFFTERITGLIPKDKFFWENFPEFFEKDLKPATAILVNLRNKYHHGAVPSNEECTKDLSIAEPYLRKILFEGLIGDDRIIIGDVIQGAKAKQVFLERADGRRIELSPLLHSELSPKSKKEELYYFNDAKKWDKGTISTMSYDVGEHVSNKELFNEFRKTFPIPDWEKTKVSRFANRIAELTENFQGRTTELSKIKNFLTESNQGFFFIWGGPGIGKSALIARSLVLVRAGLEEKTQVGETGFDLGTKELIVLEYFIRRATITEKEDTFYSMLGEDLEGIFKTGISMGNNLQEKKEKWRARLEKIQRKLNGSENIGEDEDSEEEEKPKADSKKKSSEDSFVGKKLILCIDGLDEGEEGILRSIPRGSDLYSNILFVLGGRDVTQTRTLFTTLDADKKAEIVLHGLSETDIRVIMLKVGNSENLPSEYIAKLLKVSEGNPLYLKMISDSIERGERQAGDLENLPAGVDNLYDGIYERFSKLKDSEILLKILYFFTFARDFLSVDVVAYFLQLEYFRAEFLVGEIREVLWKDPQREEVDFLQLFHESLRDYLRKKYDRERFGIQKVILDGLLGWKALCEEGIDPRTARYILQYGVTHLLEEGEQKQAEKFVLDPEFVKYQVEYLSLYTVSLDDAVKVLDRIVEELAGKPGTTRPIEDIFKPKLEGEEFRTTTLVRLVNHAGELGHKAGTDIGIAWTWIEEGRVEEALERLSPIQDKQRLFDCYLYILWMLSENPDNEENIEWIKKILSKVDETFSTEMTIIKWHSRLNEKLFKNLISFLINKKIEFQILIKYGDSSNQYEVYRLLIDSFILKLSDHSEIKNYNNIIYYYNELYNNIILINQESYRFRGIIYFIKLLYFMNDEKIIKNFISEILFFCLENKDNPQLKETLIELTFIILKINNPLVVYVFYKKIISLIFNLEDEIEKLTILKELTESLSFKTDSTKVICYFTILKCFKRSSKSPEFFSVIQSLSISFFSLQNNKHTKNLYNELIYNITSIDQNFNSIFTLLKMIELNILNNNLSNHRTILLFTIKEFKKLSNSYERFYILISMGEILYYLKKYKISEIIFNKVEEILINLDGYDKVTNIINLGNSYVLINNFGKALSHYSIALDQVKKIEDNIEKCSLYCQIGVNYTKINEINLAETAFNFSSSLVINNQDTTEVRRILEIIFDNIVNLKNENLQYKFLNSIIKLSLAILEISEKYLTISILIKNFSKIYNVSQKNDLILEILNYIEISESSDYVFIVLNNLFNYLKTTEDIIFFKIVHEKSLRIFEKMDWNNLKNLTFYTMIESLDYFLDDTIKIEILDKTLLYVRNKIIFNSTNIILFKIGLSFFKIEKIERAESLFIESLKSYIQIDNSNTILLNIEKLFKQSIRHDYTDYVMVRSSKLLRFINSRLDDIEKTELLLKISKILLHLNNKKLFKDLIIIQKKMIRSIDYKSQAIEIFINLLEIYINTINISIKNLMRIVHLIDELENLNLKAKYYFEIACILHKNKFHENLKNEIVIKSIRILSNVNDIDKFYNLIDTTLKFLPKCLREDNFHENIQMLYNFINKIDSYWERNSYLTEIIKSFSNISQPIIFYKSFSLFIKILLSIEASSEKFYAVKSIIENLIINSISIDKPEINLLEEVVLNINDLYYKILAIVIISKYYYHFKLFKKLNHNILKIKKNSENLSDPYSLSSSILFEINNLYDYYNTRDIKVKIYYSLKLSKKIEIEKDKASILIQILNVVQRIKEKDFTKKIINNISIQITLFLEYKNIEEIHNKIISIGINYPHLELLDFIEKKYSENIYSNKIIQSYVSMYNGINWEELETQNLFPYYIRSFLKKPLDSEIGLKSMYDLISSYSQLGKIEESYEAFNLFV